LQSAPIEGNIPRSMATNNHSSVFVGQKRDPSLELQFYNDFPVEYYYLNAHSSQTEVDNDKFHHKKRKIAESVVDSFRQVIDGSGIFLPTETPAKEFNKNPDSGSIAAVLTSAEFSQSSFGGGNDFTFMNVTLSPQMTRMLSDVDEISKMSPLDFQQVFEGEMVKMNSAASISREKINGTDANGYNLLHYCCLLNYCYAIRVLLMKNAEIEEKTTKGSAPIHLAAAAGHLSVVELLFEGGADLQSRDSNGNTALELAIQYNHKPVVTYLQVKEITYSQHF
jgi:hypothetical protein